MDELIVTSQPIGRDSPVMSLDDFITRATSAEGLQITGALFVDVKGLPDELYYAIRGSMPDARFFSLDGMAPEFVDLNLVYDWREHAVTAQYGRQKQTAVYDASNVDQTQSGMDESGTIESLTGDSSVHEKNIIDHQDFDKSAYDDKQARIVLFGSSKGGTGKTFTCLINAYRYAKMHPEQRVAVSDFDIIDGQVGITIHKISPTMHDYYKQFRFGKNDFQTMEKYKVKSENFPPNLDFYLAPRDMYIEDDSFWESIFINLIKNYDVVFFDSGIDYMNYKPISTLYKIADKIILISTTSIKSVSSVSKQIGRLKGEIDNAVFSRSDEIGERLNLVITQAGKTDEMNQRVFEIFKSKIDIIGVFGMITPKIQKAEYYGHWGIFDDEPKFNATLDKIVE